MFIYYLLNWYRESRYNIFLSDSQWLWQDYIPRRHIFYNPAAERLLMTEIKKNWVVFMANIFSRCIVIQQIKLARMTYQHGSQKKWNPTTHSNVFSHHKMDRNLIRICSPNNPNQLHQKSGDQTASPNIWIQISTSNDSGLKQLPSENQTWHWNTPIKMQVFMEINPKKWWISWPCLISLVAIAIYQL